MAARNSWKSRTKRKFPLYTVVICLFIGFSGHWIRQCRFRIDWNNRCWVWRQKIEMAAKFWRENILFLYSRLVIRVFIGFSGHWIRLCHFRIDWNAEMLKMKGNSTRRIPLEMDSFVQKVSRANYQAWWMLHHNYRFLMTSAFQLRGMDGRSMAICVLLCITQKLALPYQYRTFLKMN